MVLEIKRLLYEKRFTIEGARKFLDDRPRGGAAAKPGPKAVPAKAQAQAMLFDNSADAMAAIRKELTDILSLLA